MNSYQTLIASKDSKTINKNNISDMKKTKRKSVVDANDCSIRRTKQTVLKISGEIGKSNRRAIFDG